MRLPQGENNMAIGERIRYIRNLRGMTQKHLGMVIGFDEKTAVKINSIGGELCLTLDKFKGATYLCYV